MASISKKGLGLTQGNKNTHIFTEFEQMNKESTQLQVLEAIKGIQINVGDIIVGDITVESNDTGTHDRLDTANGHLDTLDNFNYKVRDLLTPTVKDLKVYDKTLDNCLGINDNDVNYLRVRETKNPSGSFGNWLDNVTILAGYPSLSFDCTALNRDSFLSYKDDNVANTGSVAIFTGDGAIIGVLNPKPDPSNTYRFAYTQINLIPFTFITLQNWSGSNLTGVVACVYSG
jgi:hypothetical protein